MAIYGALYMMFLVSEVHPFDDGNGRIARIMMNAELVRGGSSKIIIPTVYRDDYMLALRRLTRQRDASVFVRMMERASALQPFEPLDDGYLTSMQQPGRREELWLRLNEALQKQVAQVLTLCYTTRSTSALPRARKAS